MQVPILSAATYLLQVEIFCYALSPSDNSEWRQRIEREAEHFLDVSAWSVPDIAGKISADAIHIAVNLNGYTKVSSAILTAAELCAVLQTSIAMITRV